MNLQTPQQVFDHVVNSLREQGGPCFTVEGSASSCKYRGPNGRKCAAGVCIPDHLYKVTMEGEAITVLIHRHPALGYLEPFSALLRHLQSAHDGILLTQYHGLLPSDVVWLKSFEERAKSVAEVFKLVFYTPPPGVERGKHT